MGHAEIFRSLTRVVLAVAVGLSTACAADLPERTDFQVTFFQRSGHRMAAPEFELTLESAGVARLLCRRYCAVSGEITQRIPDARLQEVLDALDAARFFQLPRTDPTAENSTGRNYSRITYRDNTRIHELTDLDRVPALVAVLRTVLDLDALLTPNVTLYRDRLSKGWNINAVDESHTTALGVALLAGKTDAILWLLEHGAIPTDVDRRIAASSPDAAVIDAILAARPISSASSDGRTFLIHAIARGNVALVRRLLDRGWTVSGADAGGQTPMLTAVRGQTWEMIELILSKGGDPNGVDAAGRPLLWTAAESYNTAAIHLLARHGARVNAQDSQGRSALMHAASRCLAWNVEALLRVGADPTLRDASGRTARDFSLPPRDADYDKCTASRALLIRP